MGAVLSVAVAVIAVFTIVRATSRDSSRSWKPAGLQGTLIHGLAAIPGHRSVLLAAGQGGIDRESVGRPWRRVLSSSEVWAITTTATGRLSMAGDENGDVEISSDAGLHWRRVRVTSQAVYAISVDPRDPRIWLAGAGGGLYRSSDSGVRWHRVLSLANAAISAFSWPRQSSGTALAGAVAGQAGASTSVYASKNAGRTWVVTGHGLRSGAGIMSLVSLSGRRVVAGTMGHAAWILNGASGFWRSAASGMPATEDHVSALSVTPSRPPLLFAATLSYGVFESKDSGLHWSNIGNGLTSASNANIALALLYVPAKRTLFAGTADGVYALHPAG